MDGLRCQAPANAHGLITADALAGFVEGRVLTWIRRNRNRNVALATQLILDGSSKAMPLSSCSGRIVLPPVPPNTAQGSGSQRSPDQVQLPPAGSIDRIPLDATYDIELSGQTSEGPFKIAGMMMVVPCANPDAAYIGGHAHPLDLAIRTSTSPIASGVRGSLYFFTNSRLTEIVGGAEHVKNAAVNVCSIAADGGTGRVRIELDPEYAPGNGLNLMTLGTGMPAIGKQIHSGSIELEFREDGVVGGVIRLSTGRYANAGNVEYTATLSGRRRAP